jgi:mono/diheme cytochrome c family protein
MLARAFLALALPACAAAAQADKVDFAAQIAPILKERCVKCHGAKEQEGDLRLDRRGDVFHDRKDDWVIVPGKPDDSTLVRRIELDADDADVMPAEGDPLERAQIALIRRWIAEGADWPEAAVIEAEAAPAETFDVAPPTEEQRAAIGRAMAALRARGAIVAPIAPGRAALDANLSLLRPPAGAADLALLAPLAPVLVHLDLTGAKVGADELSALVSLVELRRLHLANTPTGDAGLDHVASLPRLEFLNLYGTRVGDAGLARLRGATALRKVFLWRTAVTDAGVDALARSLPELTIDRGAHADVLAKIAAEREAQAPKPVNEKCPVADKPVDPAVFVLREGRAIAFCCEDCKAKFAADPAKFEAKLPAK